MTCRSSGARLGARAGPIAHGRDDLEREPRLADERGVRRKGVDVRQREGRCDHDPDPGPSFVRDLSEADPIEEAGGTNIRKKGKDLAGAPFEEGERLIRSGKVFDREPQFFQQGDRMVANDELVLYHDDGPGLECTLT